MGSQQWRWLPDDGLIGSAPTTPCGAPVDLLHRVRERRWLQTLP